MKVTTFLLLALGVASNGQAKPIGSEPFGKDIASFMQSHCVACHDSGTETELNLECLGGALNDYETLGAWVNVFDRIQSGEMLTGSEPRPSANESNFVSANLRKEFHRHNLAQQSKRGRVPARRLTRLDYGYNHGHYVDMKTSTDLPLCNRFVRLLQDAGIEVNSFGQSTGALSWT